MDTDMDAKTTDDAASTSTTAQVHPLVVLHMSDHYTRTKALSAHASPVYGVLMGVQSGRHVEFVQAYEVPPLDGLPNVEHMNTHEQLLGEVVKDVDMVGWYTVGDDASLDLTPADTAAFAEASRAHAQARLAANKQPNALALLKLAPTLKATEKLPLRVYEASLVDAAAFHAIEWKMHTLPVERVGVEHIARNASLPHTAVAAKGDKTSAANTAVPPAAHLKQLQAMLGSLKMLKSRLQLIRSYVLAVSKGELDGDDDMAGEVAQLNKLMASMTSTPSTSVDDDARMLAMLGHATGTLRHMTAVIDHCNAANARAAQRGMLMHGGRMAQVMSLGAHAQPRSTPSRRHRHTAPEHAF